MFAKFAKFLTTKKCIIIFLIIILTFKFREISRNERIHKILSHECICFKEKIISIKSTNNQFEKIIDYDGQSYSIDLNRISLACDLYKVLKRGPKQKVISYSLYGKNLRYYKVISNLTQKVKEFYPGHVMRIYHDDSINNSIICELECTNSHIDFCNIHKLPLSLDKFDQVLNLNYIHSMMWRFLPIGDTFVDYFMSRDLDSMLIRREVDSVQEWLSSDNIGHIMRDNNQHGTHILGGMWSFKNFKDRKLAKEIYDLVIDKNLSVKYKPNGNSRKGYDQHFLSHHVYHRINMKSTVHDSYLCKRYPNSRPFPSKRIGDCFVGRTGFCNESRVDYGRCPKECRPPNHLDWENC
ncbi:unnamed protein product [Brachionus calyciflorus]|uniref:Uncharacterized protein n=1 Tax=Brachionus calyciflorus TaxID=104777 RepID=A0A813X4S4_9BILA|nr:unnamed protein product [Brachionus calyciflorus]